MEIRIVKCKDCGKEIKWDLKFSIMPPKKCEVCSEKKFIENINFYIKRKEELK